MEPAALTAAGDRACQAMSRPRALTCEPYALYCDEYELTMAQSFLRHLQTGLVAFELSVRRLPPNRGYLVAAGLEQVLAHLESLRFDAPALEYLRATGAYDEQFLQHLAALRFSGNVEAVPEGTVVGADTPILRITAPRIEATIVESWVLATINHQTSIATKAARVVDAAAGRPVWDFSLRRVQGPEAGVAVARAAYIGGVAGSATVVAGQRLGIPTTGTMAHHFVLLFGPAGELAAYEQFLRDYPNRATLLIDTYDTVAAVDRVIAAAHDTGVTVTGVRIDSGDLMAVADEVRRRFDAAGLRDVHIVLSGDLDEYRIRDLLAQGTPVDSFGVGTMLGTSYDAPALSAVYKLVSQQEGGLMQPVMKHSTDKLTEPGVHQVFRTPAGDVIGLDDEDIAGRRLLAPVMSNGSAHDVPRLQEIRERALAQVAALPAEVRRLEDPAEWPVARSERLRALRRSLGARE
ncbi:MAG: nicotinate phosphoribosyltransferase [Candidatus Dormibacteraeota bacterium]|nr:nicotinate phosphoribosyltransferase [Candidatus Dormibacteraeota bacterium]